MAHRHSAAGSQRSAGGTGHPPRPDSPQPMGSSLPSSIAAIGQSCSGPNGRASRASQRAG
eukprot:3023053-Alexandrium_andersonii.AAC.1